MDARLLNPLTSARRATASGDLLELRSFARGRSYQPLFVERRVEADLFDWLHDWVDRGEAVDEKAPTLTTEQAMRLLGCGVVLSPAERGAMPNSARPGWGDGSEHAALICPSAAEYLRAPPWAPPASPGLDRDLAKQGFTLLDNPLLDAELAPIRAYYRSLFEGGWLKQDAAGIRRQIIHDDPIARRLQFALVSFISGLAGQSVKPSFSYATRYPEGAELKRHIDREQCEWTVSLLLDHGSSGASNRLDWPLLLHAPAGDMAIIQSIGEGVLFCGRQIPHSRPLLADGQWAQMALLCYVPAGFTGPLL